MFKKVLKNYLLKKLMKRQIVFGKKVYLTKSFLMNCDMKTEDHHFDILRQVSFPKVDICSLDDIMNYLI